MTSLPQVLEESLSSPEATVQQSAVPALPALLQRLLMTEGDLDTAARDKLLDSYLRHLTTGEVARRGFSSGLGALPAHLLLGREEDVVMALIKCSKISEGTEGWAEARKDAVRGLASVAATVVTALEQRLVPHLYDCFLLSLEDYTIDRRGDTGAWVREAAMSALETLSLALLTQGSHRVPGSIIAQVLPCLAQQATEKIARTRGHAGRVFHALLWARGAAGQVLPGVPARGQLEIIFPEVLNITWIVESETFPRFVKLLRLKEFSERMILGLTVSIGGLTERLVRNSSSSLFTELRAMEQEEVEVFAAQLLTVFKKHQKVDRVTLPLLKFLDQLLTSGCLEGVLMDSSSSFPGLLFTLCKAEISKSGDPNKLMWSADVFCQVSRTAGSSVTCCSSCCRPRTEPRW